MTSLVLTKKIFNLEQLKAIPELKMGTSCIRVEYVKNYDGNIVISSKMPNMVI